MALVLMISSPSSLASEPQAPLPVLPKHGKASTIKVTPRSCIQTAENSTCDQPVVMSWQFDKPTDFCVSTSEHKVVFCQQQQTKGSRVISPRLTQTTEFVIHTPKTKEIYANVVVYMLTGTASQQYSSYRHPWSIF